MAFVYEGGAWPWAGTAPLLNTPSTHSSHPQCQQVQAQKQRRGSRAPSQCHFAQAQRCQQKLILAALCFSPGASLHHSSTYRIYNFLSRLRGGIFSFLFWCDGGPPVVCYLECGIRFLACTLCILMRQIDNCGHARQHQSIALFVY